MAGAEQGSDAESGYPLNLVTIELPVDADPKIVDSGGLADWFIYAGLEQIMRAMVAEEENQLELTPNEDGSQTELE